MPAPRLRLGGKGLCLSPAAATRRSTCSGRRQRSVFPQQLSRSPPADTSFTGDAAAFPQSPLPGTILTRSTSGPPGTTNLTSATCPALTNDMRLSCAHSARKLGRSSGRLWHLRAGTLQAIHSRRARRRTGSRHSAHPARSPHRDVCVPYCRMRARARSGRIWPAAAGPFVRSIDGHLARRRPPDRSRRTKSTAGIGLTPTDGVTLSDGEGQGERMPRRRYGRSSGLADQSPAAHGIVDLRQPGVPGRRGSRLLRANHVLLRECFGIKASRPQDGPVGPGC
jgi:hypothetical protein